MNDETKNIILKYLKKGKITDNDLLDFTERKVYKENYRRMKYLKKHMRAIKILLQ